MTSDHKLSWVIDGITLQHAGELLFDAPIYNPKLSRDIYLSCLEDFVFTIVYGDSFITAGRMPKASGGSPGEDLALKFGDFRKKPNRKVKPKPDFLLNDNEYRQHIKKDLCSLTDSLFLQNKTYWEAWIQRELSLYFGNDKSLFDKNCHKYNIAFKKRPPYFIDEELQSYIPPSFVNNLIFFLQNNNLLTKSTPIANIQFVERSLLSMIVISWWYDLQWEQVDSSIRIPFKLRSLIKHSSRLQQSSLSIKKHRVLKNLIVRHTLADILLTYQALKRDEIIDILGTIRDQEPYKTLRKYWGYLRYVMEQGSESEIDELISAISKRSSPHSSTHQPIILDKEMVIDDNSSIHNIKRVLAIFPFFTQDYITSLYRLFPVLNPDYIQSNIGIVEQKPHIIKILFLAANPRDTRSLDLSTEVSIIQRNLKLAKEHESLVFKSEWAVTADTLIQSILDEAPTIIHFSGHGRENGIILEDEARLSKLVTGESLGKMFELCKDTVACVILNACYSEEQAKFIKLHIPYVIGMRENISDKAALSFTTGFYKAIGAGKDIDDAFEWGKVSMDMDNMLTDNMPFLLHSDT